MVHMYVCTNPFVNSYKYLTCSYINKQSTNMWYRLSDNIKYITHDITNWSVDHFKINKHTTAQGEWPLSACTLTIKYLPYCVKFIDFCHQLRVLCELNLGGAHYRIKHCFFHKINYA